MDAALYRRAGPDQKTYLFASPLRNPIDDQGAPQPWYKERLMRLFAHVQCKRFETLYGSTRADTSPTVIAGRK